MSNKQIYRIIFYNQSQIFEIYAKQLYQSDLYGFIEIEELIFGEKSQMVVDPAEEKLKSTFSGVKRCYVPLHAIIRIDEVEKEGSPKISDVKEGKSNKVTPFPMPPIPPNDG